MQTDALTPLPAAEENPAQIDIHPLIAQRRSRRAFSSRLVEPDTLRTLFEAARWAPSSMNEQPWSFIVAARQNQTDFERLLDCLMDFNLLWARHASVLLLAVARSNFSANGEHNRHAFYDLGQAVAALSYQAIASGLSVCQMAGFDLQKARSVFSIPAEHEPVVVVAIGYRGDSAGLTERTRQKELAPRKRNSLNEFVFEAKWGQPAQFSRPLSLFPSMEL
jgi:nitroreductase